MYDAGYQQNDACEQQYQSAREAVKAAMNRFEQLRPDQQQRLLQELIQEKTLEELWYRMNLFFSGQ
ncbi:MAG: hypothetical protein IKN04_00005 [Clostridia bacterium]|nr:hypothetical protein [Clostridia bacterium]